MTQRGRAGRLQERDTANESAPLGSERGLRQASAGPARPHRRWPGPLSRQGGGPSQEGARQASARWPVGWNWADQANAATAGECGQRWPRAGPWEDVDLPAAGSSVCSGRRLTSDPARNQLPAPRAWPCGPGSLRGSPSDSEVPCHPLVTAGHSLEPVLSLPDASPSPRPGSRWSPTPWPHPIQPSQEAPPQAHVPAG